MNNINKYGLVFLLVVLDANIVYSDVLLENVVVFSKMMFFNLKTLLFSIVNKPLLAQIYDIKTVFEDCYVQKLYYTRTKARETIMKMKEEARLWCQKARSRDETDDNYVKTHDNLTLGRSTVWINSNDFRFIRQYRNKGDSSGKEHCFHHTGKIQCIENILKCHKKYKQLAKATSVVKITKLMADFHLFCGVNRYDFYNFAKSMTGELKRMNFAFDVDWQELLYVENWIGFSLSSALGEQQAQEARDWMEGEKIIGNQFWCDALLDAMKTIELHKNADHPQTIAEYIQNFDNWVTHGSGSQKFENVKSRAAFAQNQTTAQIKKRIESETKDRIIKPSVKVEVGLKERVFAVGDELTQIQQGFVTKRIEQWIKRSKQKYLYPYLGSNKQYIRMGEIFKQMQGKNIIAYPYDAPSFDQRVGTNEIQAFCKYCEYAVEFESEEVKNTAKQLYDNWQECKVEMFEFGSFKWGHGMPSGFRVTAFGDTMINYARTILFIKGLESVFNTNLQWDGLFQGDDILFITNNLAVIEMHQMFVDKAGIGANVIKNNISDETFEFLRKVKVENKYIGYLARKMTTLVFRDPISKMTSTGLSLMNERVRMISAAVSRGAQNNKGIVIAEGAIKRMNTRLMSIKGQKPTQQQLINVMYTPVWLNGLGVWPVRTIDQMIGMKAVVDDKNEKVVPQGVFLETAELMRREYGVTPITNEFKKILADRLLKKGGQRTEWMMEVIQEDKTIKIKVPHTPKMYEREGVALLLTWSPGGKWPYTYTKEVIREKVNEKDWSGIVGLMREKDMLTFEVIRQRGSRALLYEWLAGKLRLRSGIYFGHSAAEVARAKNISLRFLQFYFFGQKRLTLSTINQMERLLFDMTTYILLHPVSEYVACE